MRHQLTIKTLSITGQTDIGSKGMLAVGGDLYGILLVGDSNGFALTLTIVPKSGLETCFAIHTTLIVIGFKRLVVDQVAALECYDLAFL